MKTPGRRFRILAVVGPALFLLHSAVSRATVTSALIAKALDSQQRLEIKATLPQAMEQIGNLTGVRIEADPAVWDLLPWGEQTDIAATISNHTLRDGLSAITRKLGLEFVLTDEAVQLRPMPALRRLGRRATVTELAALDLLASTPLKLKGDRPTVHELLGAIDNDLEAAKTPYAVENRAPDASQDQHIGIARQTTIGEALDAMSAQSNVTWYPWGRSVIVLSKVEQIRTQLAKTVNANYRGVDVGQVLLELFQKAGVDFSVDPGAYEKVPAAHRNIQLLLDNATVQQAVDTIAGYTGLSFEIGDAGVKVHLPNATTQP